MARNKKCMTCKYAGCLEGRSSSNWREKYTCDYFLRTGRLDNKGDDPKKCKLFEKSKG